MRIAAAILSVYLMFLTVLPCCAFDNCPEERQATEVSAQADDHQGGDKDGCGTCSPFFNCHHCSGFNFSVKTIAFSTKTVDVPTDKPVIFENRFIPSTYVGNIWQPPKA